MEDYAKKDMEDLFPGESYYKAIDLIKKVKRLVPITSKSSIDYLENIISYVDGLLNGDDIYSYTTFAYASKYAKEAFKEITDEIHEHALEEYRRERAKLQEEVSTLSTKQNVLADSVEELEKRKNDLQQQLGLVSVELAAKKKELDDLKQSGINQVNKEVSSIRERLDNEINSLTRSKKSLESSIEELKKMYDSYSVTVSELCKERTEITWKPVSNNSPIYNTNYRTIESYIESLKIEYMDKTGVSREVCDKEFNKNCPGLSQFIEVLKSFCFTDIPACSSLKSIISKDDWSSSFHQKADSLNSMLKLFKFPCFQPVVSNIDTCSLTRETIPTNINSMLRELYLQRIATEAITKQRIAEAELRSVIAILKTVAPKDFDFRSLLSYYNGFDSLLSGAIEDENLVIQSDQSRLQLKDN